MPSERVARAHRPLRRAVCRNATAIEATTKGARRHTIWSLCRFGPRVETTWPASGRSYGGASLEVGSPLVAQYALRPGT